MSTYTQNFNEYTTGSAPSDWTDRWGTNWTTNVESFTSGYGDKRLEINPDTADQRKMLSWNDIDSDANRDDAEVLVRFSTADTSVDFNWFGVGARASGSTSSETGYFAIMSSDELKIYKYDAGSSSQLGSTYDTGRGATAWDDRYYWLRFRVNGTNLYAKVWRSDRPEPGAWQIETTDSAISAAGWVGVWNYESNSGDIYVDYFAVGTDGDSPSLPTDTSATIRADRQHLDVAQAVASTDTTMKVDRQHLDVGEHITSPTIRVKSQTLSVGEQSVPKARVTWMGVEVMSEYVEDSGQDYVVVCIN